MPAAAQARPRLLIVAGPNGAGKTTVTEAGLAHQWFEGCEYVNPDFIAHDLGDWNDEATVGRAATIAAERREACLRERPRTRAVATSVQPSASPSEGSTQTPSPTRSGRRARGSRSGSAATSRTTRSGPPSRHCESTPVRSSEIGSETGAGSAEFQRSHARCRMPRALAWGSGLSDVARASSWTARCERAGGAHSRRQTAHHRKAEAHAAPRTGP